MAFRRKSRKAVKLEFLGANDERLVYEVEYSPSLGDRLTKIGKDLENSDNSEEEQKKYLIKAYDEMLGQGAMKEIQKVIFENDELLISDLIDIGFYIITEVEKKNKEIDEEYKLDTVIAQDKQAVQNVLTIEQIQRLINGQNQLPN